MGDKIMARRRGKVARLSKEMRDQINQKLQDGLKYGEVSQWLVDQGEKGIDEAHLCVWYQGGYAEWLKQRNKLEETRVRSEFAMDYAKENGTGAFEEATLRMAGAQLFDIVCEFDLETLKSMFEEKPEQYVKFLNAFTRLCHGSLNFEKLKELLRNRAFAEGVIRPDGAVTAETMRKIKEALNLM
jgi:hypothetical protein